VVSVVAHVAAAEYAEMVAAIERGDLCDGAQLHRRLLPAVRAVMARLAGGDHPRRRCTPPADRLAGDAPAAVEATDDEVAAVLRERSAGASRRERTLRALIEHSAAERGDERQRGGA
jgi:hypothetical protein